MLLNEPYMMKVEKVCNDEGSSLSSELGCTSLGTPDISCRLFLKCKCKILITVPLK